VLDGDESLSESDLTRLADLHVDAIDDSIPSFLGRGYATHLYRFLAGSERETVLVERLEGRIASACVVSFDPNSVQRRIVRGTFPALLAYAVAAWLRCRDFRQFVAATIRDVLRRGGQGFAGPEIVYLFTDAALRGRGLGQRLIERTDALIRRRGESSYFVQTLDTSDNRAITFYENSGFVRVGDREERDRRFVLFHRTLDPA
jgi:GNAT superfamily N-acetyltransferase